MTPVKEITPPTRFAGTLPIEGREGANPPQGLLDVAGSPVTARNAKALRKSLTGPEAKLWAHLKRIKTIDTHFRKQVPIGPYIADFACMRARLVIEIDGQQHGRNAGVVRDERRTAFLEAQGFSVIRFWNHEVLQQMESVLDTIYAKLHGSISALPLSASKARTAGGRAPSSPSMGKVARLAGSEGVTTLAFPEARRRT